MIKCIGDHELTEIDDANIPINIFITMLSEDDLAELDENYPPDEEDPEDKPLSTWAKWQLSADILMPRKGTSDDDIKYVADTREELSKLVKEMILPHYQIALGAVTRISEGKRKTFYYWNEKDDEDEDA